MNGVLLADTLIAQNVFFYVFAAMMVVSAIMMVTTKNIVHAALYLVVVLLGVAAIFVLTLAPFLAAAQVLVYVGAIVVLFLFGIMLTRAKVGKDDEVDHEHRWVAASVGLLLFAVMGYSLWDAFDTTDITSRGALGGDLSIGSTAAVSDSIFGDYLIPFEAVSLLLLAALIGAIVVARRE